MTADTQAPSKEKVQTFTVLGITGVPHGTQLVKLEDYERLQQKLVEQAAAADHWMSEACRDHNELVKRAALEPKVCACPPSAADPTKPNCQGPDNTAALCRAESAQPPEAEPPNTVTVSVRGELPVSAIFRHAREIARLTETWPADRDSYYRELLQACVDGWTKGDDIAGPMLRAKAALTKRSDDHGA